MLVMILGEMSYSGGDWHKSGRKPGMWKSGISDF